MSTPSTFNHCPAETDARKGLPITSGVIDYFPDALLAVAMISKAGNDQHNPGQPLHWARGKSTDHADALGRHLVDRGKVDSDGYLHTAKMAWRALALLQEEIEAENVKLNPQFPPDDYMPRGASRDFIIGETTVTETFAQIEKEAAEKAAAEKFYSGEQWQQAFEDAIAYGEGHVNLGPMPTHPAQWSAQSIAIVRRDFVYDLVTGFVVKVIPGAEDWRMLTDSECGLILDAISAYGRELIYDAEYLIIPRMPDTPSLDELARKAVEGTFPEFEQMAQAQVGESELDKSKLENIIKEATETRSSVVSAGEAIDADEPANFRLVVTGLTRREKKALEAIIGQFA